MSEARRLRALLGDYPVSAALRRGRLHSDLVEFDFAEVASIPAGFKRVVRDLEFDFAEMAIMTYLIALAHDRPIVLLPTVLVARWQHPYLVHDAARGPLAPEALAGKRVGIRSYSVTTSAWVRGILADEHGVDPDRVRWVTFEEPHVAGFVDPPSVERAPAGTTMMQMLLAGEIDAAVTPEVPQDPRVRPVFADPAAAARAWHAKHGALQINHLTCVTRRLSEERPDLVREIHRLLVASRACAPAVAPGAIDFNPFGVEANRRNLEVAIDCAYKQRLIPRRFAVEELFDRTTIAL